MTKKNLVTNHVRVLPHLSLFFRLLLGLSLQIFRFWFKCLDFHWLNVSEHMLCWDSLPWMTPNICSSDILRCFSRASYNVFFSLSFMNFPVLVGFKSSVMQLKAINSMSIFIHPCQWWVCFPLTTFIITPYYSMLQVPGILMNTPETQAITVFSTVSCVPKVFDWHHKTCVCAGLQLSDRCPLYECINFWGNMYHPIATKIEFAAIAKTVLATKSNLTGEQRKGRVTHKSSWLLTPSLPGLLSPSYQYSAKDQWQSFSAAFLFNERDTVNTKVKSRL